MNSSEQSDFGTVDLWLEHWRSFSSHRLRLFCFPHAGGTAALYRDWHEHLAAEIEVCPVQLPGRGRRLEEPLLTSLDVAVQRLTSALLPVFQWSPFALFGHSMGALLAFEVARFLELNYAVSPELIFVAGARAPHLRDQVRNRWNLPNSELLAELRSMNGTPSEILEDAEAMRFLLPIIRADFQMIETYEFDFNAGVSVSSPIVAFGGVHDQEVSQSDLEGWRQYTRGSFSSGMILGDHFFVNQSRAEVLRQVAEQLQGCCAHRTKMQSGIGAQSEYLQQPRTARNRTRYPTSSGKEKTCQP